MPGTGNIANFLALHEKLRSTEAALRMQLAKAEQLEKEGKVAEANAMKKALHVRHEKLQQFRSHLMSEAARAQALQAAQCASIGCTSPISPPLRLLVYLHFVFARI